MKTEFDRVLDKAAETHLALKATEARRKLNPAAFVAHACANAGISAERLAAVRELIAASDADEAKAFIRRMSAVFRDPNFPCAPPPEKIGQMARVYGTESLEGELARIGVKPGEAIAAAAALTAERHPDAFGSILNWPAHLVEVASLRDFLNKLIAQLRIQWTPADLEFDRTKLTPTERASGTCRITLRRASNISMAADDWPQRLIEHAAAGKKLIDDSKLGEARSKLGEARMRRRSPSASAAEGSG